MSYKEQKLKFRIHLETNGKDLALRKRPVLNNERALKKELSYFLRSFLFGKGDTIVIEVL